ncbi:MAG TPA: cellulase family glycosylhydrolase [Actinocrinis sp.]|jgi:endo-1,4-beta-mannosidase
MHRPSPRLPGLREPGAQWIGANFWSRAGGPLMWRTFDPQLVRDELAVLREHGLGFTRSFFYWPDFMPEPDRIDEKAAEAFAVFLDLHAELGMATIPTLFVGHMSGENWDPAWRGDRDLYQDVWMVARQAWFAGEMAHRYAGHPAVAAWLLTNEMPLYGGPAPHEAVAAWAQLVISALREAGAHQPVSLGDGAWGLEVTGRDNGFRLRDQARLCDFLGPHCYPMGDDRVRQHYAAAWICELAGGFDRPVVLEEFGLTSDFASHANAAHFYRQVLHNSLLAGATGWGAWNNTDFDGLEHQDPYRHHAFELHFGLTDTAGTPKPQLLELREFSRLLGEVDIARLRRSDAQTALVVSSFLDTQYPFTEPTDGSTLHETLRQAYIAARLADLPVAVLRESDGIRPAQAPGAPDARLYLVPSTKQLLSPTWRELTALAERGATVYASYCCGPHMNQRGSWHNALNDVFGFEHQLSYGLVDEAPEEGFEFSFTRDFGPLAAGTRLAFRTAPRPYSRAMLPVEPREAEVVAVDGQGRPALLVRRVGRGAMVFCTYPIEHMASGTPRVNPEPTRDLYDALAEVAGVVRPVRVEDPRVAADLMVHQDGTRYAWLVSQADEALEVKPALAAGSLPQGQDTVTIPPFGVRVLKLEG